MVKDHLKENKFGFREVDVSANSKNASEMVDLSGQMGVPVLNIGGKIIIGWNKAQIDETLKGYVV